jgi:hypothetical protein
MSPQRIVLKVRVVAMDNGRFVAFEGLKFTKAQCHRESLSQAIEPRSPGAAARNCRQQGSNSLPPAITGKVRCRKLSRGPAMLLDCNHHHRSPSPLAVGHSVKVPFFAV